MGYFKETISNLASEGLKYASDFAKNQCPKIKSHNEKVVGKFHDLKEETSPKLSKFILDKYSEAAQLTKRAEEEQKKNRARAIRHGIIATTVGFAAGAATGYLLVKKSQIKDSDYVFSDEEVVETVLPEDNTEATFQEMPEQETVEQGPQKKTYKDFNEVYQMSTDGTTLIKK